MSTHKRYVGAVQHCPCGSEATRIDNTGPVCQQCMDREANHSRCHAGRRLRLGISGSDKIELPLSTDNVDCYHYHGKKV